MPNVFDGPVCLSRLAQIVRQLAESDVVNALREEGDDFLCYGTSCLLAAEEPRRIRGGGSVDETIEITTQDSHVKMGTPLWHRRELRAFELCNDFLCHTMGFCIA